MSNTLQPHELEPARILSPWNSPGKNTGVGCHALLQEIFPTQGLNMCLMSPALAGGFFTTSAMWEAQACVRGQQLCTSWHHRARQWSLPSPDTLCLKTIKGIGAGKMMNSGNSIPHFYSIPQGPTAVGWMAFFPVALLYLIVDIYCTNAYVCIVLLCSL